MLALSLIIMMHQEEEEELTGLMMQGYNGLGLQVRHSFMDRLTISIYVIFALLLTPHTAR